nr:selenocysteine-specific translation elongation factor [Hyphomonas sp. Mor2]
MTDKTIAVIGHVDHGKTALVKALTGIETDTLAEERARGLTIQLGFARVATPSGYIHLIDTPGHADFVRTTAAGLSGVSTVLLVVSAVEGVKRQTHDYLHLARMLGIKNVISVLTKSDLAEARTIEDRRIEVEQLMKSVELSPSPILVTSARTTDGLSELKAVLQNHAGRCAEHPDLPGFFLPVDRVFSAPGAGTIVTGTLIGHSVSQDAAATILPAGLDATVRDIHVAGHSKRSSEAGSRVALNLRGVSTSQISRGDVVCAANTFKASRCFDVFLTSKPDTSVDIEHMERVMVMWGTTHEAARVRLYPSSEKGRQFVQLQFEHPQPGFRGQCFALRNPNTAKTIIGGKILDPEARLVRKNKPLHVAVLDAAQENDLTALADALANRDKGVIQLAELSRLIGKPSPVIGASLPRGLRVLNPETVIREKDIEDAADAYLLSLADLHVARPLRPHHPTASVRARLKRRQTELFEQAERDLLRSERVVAVEGFVALAEHDPFAAMTPEQQDVYSDAIERLANMDLRPTHLFGSKEMTTEQADMIELMISERIAVRLYNHALKQSILLHQSVVTEALKVLSQHFPAGTTFTTGQAREILNTNRKTIVPLLEHFDLTEQTRRDGDMRIILA